MKIGIAGKKGVTRVMSEENIDLTKLLFAVNSIFHVVEQIEQVLEEIIDCNDARLVQARIAMADAEITLSELEDMLK